MSAGICKTCNGTRMVDDGQLHCSSGGIPFENGPINCVKDCPDCNAPHAPGSTLKVMRGPGGGLYLSGVEDLREGDVFRREVRG